MDTNTIEFFKDPAQAEESQIFPQAVAPGFNVQGLCSFIRVQDSEGIGLHPFKHPSAFNFFGKGRNDAVTIQVDIEIQFGPFDDLGDMKGFLGGKKQVIDDTHLGPTFSAGFEFRLFPLFEELADDFQLCF